MVDLHCSVTNARQITSDSYGENASLETTSNVPKLNICYWIITDSPIPSEASKTRSLEMERIIPSTKAYYINQLNNTSIYIITNRQREADCSSIYAGSPRSFLRPRPKAWNRVATHDDEVVSVHVFQAVLCWDSYLELTPELAFQLKVWFLALRLQTAGVVNWKASRKQRRQVLRLYIEPEGTFIYTHWQVVSHALFTLELDLAVF